MRKLLSKPAGTQRESPPSDLSATAIPTFYRSKGPQDAVRQVGAPIVAVDKSPDGQSAVLAGRHILKTVKVDGSEIKDAVDLRALITGQPAFGMNSSASVADQLSIRDVKWATGRFSTTVFTACVTGKIFQYDLAQLGGKTLGGAVDFIQTQEDSRQINTLDINPHRGTYLLAGSQDSVVRCFDLRMPVPPRLGPGPRPVLTFRCNADSVRHVKWSPKHAFLFACGTEQGFVLKWDMRKASLPALKISGHEKACASVSWHPDGEHLLTGGSDKKCHVWDMSETADKRQKPKYTIFTPSSVASVSWRPGQWSATCQGLRAAQVAVSYEVSVSKRSGINAVHIWDLARPTMAYKTVERFECSPSSILWKNQDLLWTAGQDGLFSQCDISFAPRVIDRTSVSTFAFSSRGDAVMFLDERLPSDRPRFASTHADVTASRSPTVVIPSSYNSDPSMPALSMARSDSEDDVVRTFLLPRRQAGRKRRADSSQQLSSTPPSELQTKEKQCLPLERTLRVTGIYRPQQIMAIGRIPSATHKDVYGYLATVYLEALSAPLLAAQTNSAPRSLPDRVYYIMQQYAHAAECVSQYRLAQVWRILAFAVNLLLEKRSRYHQEKQKRIRQGISSLPRSRNSEQSLARRFGGDFLGPMRSGLSNRALPVRSLLAEEIESTSNVTTPLIRPVSDAKMNAQRGSRYYTTGLFHNGSGETTGADDDSFALPSALHRDASFGDRPAARRHLNSMPLSETSQGSESYQVPSTGGYDFYGTEAITDPIDVPRLPNKRQMSFVSEFTSSSNSLGSPHVSRRDSDFAQSSGHLFNISQTGHASPSDDESGANMQKAGGATAPYLNRKNSYADDASQETDVSGHSLRDDGASTPNGAIARSAVPRRLVHLNKALGAFRWTGADLGWSPPATSDTKPNGHGHHGHHDTTRNPTEQIEPQAHGTSVPNKDNANGDARYGIGSSVVDSPFPSDGICLPWPDDPTYPFALGQGHGSNSDDSDDGSNACPALDPYVVIKRALSFETRTSPLNAAAMVLLLRPLVPEGTIDPLLAQAILRQHHSRLTGMKIFLQAALLRKLCVHGWLGTGGPAQAEGDCTMRFAQAEQGVCVAYYCMACKKPREAQHPPAVASSPWRCDHCSALVSPCAVCGHRDAAPDLTDHHGPSGGSVAQAANAVLSTWWYCAGCGHGGHSSCLESWHSSALGGLASSSSGPLAFGNSGSAGGGSSGVGTAFSGGCCPLDGCGHVCLLGQERSESTAARGDELASAMRETSGSQSAMKSSFLGGKQRIRDRHDKDTETGVRSDKIEVGQSRAVDLVREALLANADTSRDVSSSPPPPQTSPGDHRGSRERRKSVKFARTGDGQS